MTFRANSLNLVVKNAVTSELLVKNAGEKHKYSEIIRGFFPVVFRIFFRPLKYRKKTGKKPFFFGRFFFRRPSLHGTKLIWLFKQIHVRISDLFFHHWLSPLPTSDGVLALWSSNGLGEDMIYVNLSFIQVFVDSLKRQTSAIFLGNGHCTVSHCQCTICYHRLHQFTLSAIINYTLYTALPIIRNIRCESNV